MSELNSEFMNIPKEKFNLVQENKVIMDEKFDTKPISYFKDALMRFRKNKASIVAACIIGFLLLFALITPIFSQYQVQDMSPFYSKALPRATIFRNAGFWDGARKESMHESTYDYYVAMDSEKPTNNYKIGDNPIKKVYKEYISPDENRKYYDIRLDSYAKVGFKYVNMTEQQYKDTIAWQEENKIQLFYPVPDDSQVPKTETDNANYWYKVETIRNTHFAVKDENGNFQNIYLRNRINNNYNGNRVEGDDGSYVYATKNETGYKTRVLYSNYYLYTEGFEANFLLGATSEGKDLLVCIAVGALFSFFLAIAVSALNMLIGAIYGAIEGYYGGATDLIMERISDFLSGMPFIVLVTLFQLHLADSVGPVVSLLFAFVFTGWIGIASSVRSQFYRFKRQEYVFAARTLGASDKRLIFRHIYPNSIGTLITSSVLIIPGVIFTESTLTYLGIVNLSTSNLTSIGVLLSGGQKFLSTFPHIILFPAIFIALLEISFNLFGNGLRDAFNPSLRGMED